MLQNVNMLQKCGNGSKFIFINGNLIIVRLNLWVETDTIH